jgi:hypothetical protein
MGLAQRDPNFQAGARSANAMIDALGALDTRIRAEVGRGGDRGSIGILIAR